MSSIVAKLSHTLWTSLSVARLVGNGMDLSLGSVLSKNGLLPPNMMV